MSVLSSLRIALCCSLSLTIPLPISAAAEMLSPDAASAASGGERAITVAYLMPGDNSPMLAANKIVLNGMTAANAYYPRIRLLMVETSSDDKLEDQLKAAVLAGADVAVGPLARDRVDALLRLPELPLPVLVLNTPSTNSDGQPEVAPAVDPHALMMSLSTEFEAGYIADKAADALNELNNPNARVLILRDATKNDYRITAGYETALQKRHVPYQILPVDLATINSRRQLVGPQMNAEIVSQYSTEIAQLKLMPQTPDIERRISELQEAISVTQVSGNPDFPIALTSMGAAEASLVINRLPKKTQIWGVSLLNPGDPETNPTASSLVYDLNNVVFVDAPLVVKYDQEGFQARFGSPMPYSLPAKRLFALGVDALSMAEQWAHQYKEPALTGEAGSWSGDLNTSRILKRKPAGVVIQDGSLQLLTLEPSKPAAK